ncbi:hypothetical protein GCM10010129_68370 [Streptomyces fumigatiscleroticus]|nr:hypothetical protein GCM10010129_68370 [Streptomyces fumigatiscleroticus]
MPHRWSPALPGRFLRVGAAAAQPHRDARLRHALTGLLHWAARHEPAVAVEDLDFGAEKTREKNGRRRRFRQLVSGLPTARLRARPASMAAEPGIPVIAVDPACTSRWGAQHRRKRATWGYLPRPQGSGGVPTTIRDTRLSTSSGSRTHHRSVFGNGHMTDASRLTSWKSRGEATEEAGQRSLGRQRT